MAKASKRDELTTLQMMLNQQPGKVHFDLTDLATLFGVKRKTIANAIYAGRFPIHTFKRGHARVADVRDICAYFDRARAVD